jgi:hypothetical protein
MPKITLFLVLCATAGIGRAGLLNFEDLPAANIADFCGGGGSNVGSFYAGAGVANIGADVFGLNTACGQVGYPPSSGSINLFSEDDFTTIGFTSLVSSVSLEYVALDPIVLAAYDSGNNLLGSSTGAANTDGIDPPASNSLLSVSFSNISYVTLGNTGLADEYAFDDLAFTPQQASAAPEPGSWVLLSSLAVPVMLKLRESAKKRPPHA